MPFELITPPALLSKAMPSSPNQASAVIFPGVLGNDSELKELIQELFNISPSRPIYVYRHSLLRNPSAEVKESFSLKDHIDELEKEMYRCFPYNYNICPITFIGFSYGCHQAALLAERAKARKMDSLVYLIDGLSPESSKTYFSDEKNSLAATHTIIDIINYAIKLSSLKPLALSSKQIENFAKLSVESRIEQLVKLAQNRSIATNSKIAFERYSKILKENILTIANDQSLTESSKNLTIKALFTTKTLFPAEDNLGGWNAYAESIEVDEGLKDKSHMDLITGENAKYIAHSIHTFINKHITEASIIINKLRLVANQMEIYAKKNNQLQSRQFNIVSHLINSEVKTLSPEPSPPSSSPPLKRSPSKEEIATSLEPNNQSVKPIQAPIANEDAFLPKGIRRKNLSYSEKNFFSKHGQRLPSISTSNMKNKMSNR